MGFFDEIVDAAWLVTEPSTPPADPPWLGPPYDVVPQHCEVEIEFVRTRGISLWMSRADVFPSGVALTLEVRWEAAQQIALPVIPGDRGRSGLCLGARFDDGSRVLAASRRRHSAAGDLPPDRTIVVAPLRARPHMATIEVWVWPLPEVSLTWLLEWRAQRIRETAAYWDTSSLSKLGSHLRQVWPAPAVAT